MTSRVRTQHCKQVGENPRLEQERARHREVELLGFIWLSGFMALETFGALKLSGVAG